MYFYSFYPLYLFSRQRTTKLVKVSNLILRDIDFWRKHSWYYLFNEQSILHILSKIVENCLLTMKGDTLQTST